MMWRGKVENVTMLSGVKTKPSPNPCSNPEVMIGPIPICSEKPVICHNATRVARSRSGRCSLVSMRPTRRATRNIAAIVPMPRGAVTSPVVTTG